MRTERTVLAIVHNVAAATRLLDILPIVASDPRIRVVFSCPSSSPFTRGTDEYLRRRGVALTPWRQALAMPADLAIAASCGPNLRKVRAPLVVVPHGMGHNKIMQPDGRTGPSTGGAVHGLSAPYLMWGGTVIPDLIVLSHEEQRDRLRRDCPRAVDATLVAGDPSFDRLVASVPLREGYRQAMGVTAGQRLVLVSSTWSDRSLVGEVFGLVGRLAGQLPIDGYRIAVALHPAAIAHDHRWAYEQWLDECTGKGVLLLPEPDLWGQALVASSLVVGDYGSVTFYGAALGTPFLLASHPAGTVDPASPIGRLLEAAPRLDPDADLLAECARAIDEHDPARYEAITKLTTSHPGEAAGRLRAALYGLLDLPEPDEPAFSDAALPIRRCRLPPPRALLVTAAVTERRDGRLVTSVRREQFGRSGGFDGHLVVDVDAPGVRHLALAEIVVHRRAEDAERWIAEIFRELPRCPLAAARERDGTWLVGGSDGWLVEVDHRSEDGAVFASAVHAWLCLGEPIHELPGKLTVRLGGGEVVTASARVR